MRRKLVFTFGRPAVGKLTVARALVDAAGGRPFHNHLTVNLVLSVYDLGTPGFTRLREAIWMAVFRRAPADRVPLLVFTFNPEATLTPRFIDELFAEVAATRGEVIPAELVASESAIEAPIGSKSRRKEGTTLGVEAYRELRARGAFESPVIPSPRLRLDTEKTKPAEAAAWIASPLRPTA